MSYKRLLVHVDNARSCAQRIACAAELTARFGGQLEGLHVIPSVRFSYMADGALSTQAVDAYLDAMRNEAREAEHKFEAGTGSAGVPCTYRSVEGEIAECLSAAARYADLGIVGQHDDGDERSMPAGTVESVVLAAGTPLLVVPYIGAPAGVGRRVLVAWSGTRESARAVRDALPILTAAEAVDVLGVSNGAGSVQAAVDGACVYLDAHGVRATPHHASAGDVEVGDLLLSRVVDLGADLLVMGAYGHSRMRELILGGVTRTLLGEMTVPVLMSH